MKIVPLVLFAGMLSGCAYYQKFFGRGGDPAVAVTATEQQLAREEAAMNTRTRGSRKVSCTRARTASDNICALATRTCILAKRDQAIPDGPARCQKARLKCQTAQNRAGRTCKNTRATQTAKR
jgi:hypothetical protein